MTIWQNNIELRHVAVGDAVEFFRMPAHVRHLPQVSIYICPPPLELCEQLLEADPVVTPSTENPIKTRLFERKRHVGDYCGDIWVRIS